MHQSRYELLTLERKGYYGVVYAPDDQQVGTTDPCGDDRQMAEKNGRALVEQAERLNFQERLKNV
jgi:enhancing lycopene biosynthesis protein 2